MFRIQLLRVIAVGSISLAIFFQAHPSQAQCDTCIPSNTQLRTVTPTISKVYYQPTALSTPTYYQTYRPAYYRTYRSGYVFRRPFRPFGGFFANLFGRRTYQPVSTYYGSSLAGSSPCAQQVQRVTSYVPQKRYRLQFVNVPRTALRPISSVDPCSGCERVTMKPVTEYVRRLRFVSYTTYRPVYKYVVGPQVCSTPACTTPACPTSSVCSTTPNCSTGACGPGTQTIQPTLPGNNKTYVNPPQKQEVLKAKPDKTPNIDTKNTHLKTMPRLETLNNRTAQNSSGLRLAVYRYPIQSKQQPAPKLTKHRIEEGGWVSVQKN